jgi:Protein of unknown function (DUF2934)
MSKCSSRNTEELAYLLWEQQGRPENRSEENWLEAEYLVHPWAPSQQLAGTENEVDLRMRGLGPLTQSGAATPSESPEQSSDGSESSKKETSRSDIHPARPVIASWVAVTALLIALGMFFSFFRKTGWSSPKRG